jgi:hypothetical protein
MAKRHSSKKTINLELLVAIGVVLFMFLVIGFINIGQMGNTYSEPKGSLLEVSTQTVEIQGPVELNAADFDFRVMPE